MELNDHTDAPHPAVKRPSRWRQTRPAVLMVVAGLSAWGAVKAYAFINPPNKTVAFSVPTAPQPSVRPLQPTQEVRGPTLHVVLEHAVHPSSLEEVRFSVAFVRPPPAAP